MMREKRNFAERSRALASSEARKKYLLVYEGENTEQIYFDAIEKNRNDIGINPLIELVPIIRDYSEKGWSNPKKILDRVLRNLSESTTGQFTYETLLNWLMDYFDEEGILSTNKVSESNMWQVLNHICRYNLGVQLESNVIDVKEACEVIAAHFSGNTDIEKIVEDIPTIIQDRSITYSEGLDKICFIIDRDWHSFVSTTGNNQYQYVLNKCKERGFGFYLSNPCFEFWLLLHFDEVKSLDMEKLLNNPKVGQKKRYAERELRKLLPGYTKSKYPVDSLIPRIDIAIRNEAEFCEDEDELEHSVGSRVGLLIQEMKN